MKTTEQTITRPQRRRGPRSLDGTPGESPRINVALGRVDRARLEDVADAQNVPLAELVRRYVLDGLDAA